MSLRTFDAFPKVEDNFKERKGVGGLLSVGVITILCILFIGEVREYMSPQVMHDFFVDSFVDHDIRINVDITVKMPCKGISIDMLDVAGDSAHVQNDMTVTPVRFNGEDAIHFRDLSGYTYNEDVGSILRTAARKSVHHNDEFNGQELDACRLEGSVLVAKVDGNLHITAGGHGHGGEHMDHASINFTHRIDRLSFGPDHPGIHNPLDNSVEISRSTFERYKYDISVVPTIFSSPSRSLLTSQYAVTEYYKEIVTQNGQPTQVPGIFLSYSMEPISVRISEEYIPFMHFLVRSCSILGGFWVTAGVLYRLVDTFMSQKRAPVRR